MFTRFGVDGLSQIDKIAFDVIRGQQLAIVLVGLRILSAGGEQELRRRTRKQEKREL